MAKNDDKLTYLLQTHSEVRNEILSRINQRDNFATQFIAAAGTVLTISFLDFAFAPYLIFLLPIVSYFFSLQILYSYTIHDRCHKFLTEHIEPEISKLIGYGEEKQNYMRELHSKADSNSKNIKAPGIRKGFFEKVLLFTPAIASLLFFFLAKEKQLLNNKITVILSIISFLFFETISLITRNSFDKYENTGSLEEYGELDYMSDDIKNDTSFKKVIFLDRDGTLHVDMKNTHKVEDLKLLDVEALKELNDNYRFVIISNQDGIRRGLYDEEDMSKFNKVLMEKLKDEGVTIDAIYYSPYRRNDNHYSFKPNPGMLIRAQKELNIDMHNSFFIGDQMSDVIAGYKAEVTPILVLTGRTHTDDYDQNEYFDIIKPRVFKNLKQCVEFINNYEED